MAKAFYSMEDYKAAAYYYERCCLEKPDEKYAVSLCSCLYMEGYCKEVTEDYLAKKISLSPDKVNEIMIGFYRKIKSWSKLQECAERLSGSKAGEVLSESLYHMHSYDRCLEEILKSGIIETDHYAVMGLCCMLMDGSISCENRREYIIRLKTKKLTELIRAYEHLSENKKHSCSRKLLEEFADVLIESGDSRCIKYVRKVLNENAVIDYMGLLEKGFGSKLYYFCEEIITIYYSRSRYEYEVLRMLSYIYYYMEKFEECERYISYALVMKKSTDLIKLGCMCNLKECRELINSYEGSKNARSIQSLSRDIEKYEKILPILLCV